MGPLDKVTVGMTAEKKVLRIRVVRREGSGTGGSGIGGKAKARTLHAPYLGRRDPAARITALYAA